MYIQRNIVARLPNNCCSGNTTLHLLSHERQDFRGGGVLKLYFVLIFSKTFVQNIFHSKKNSERYYHKCM